MGHTPYDDMKKIFLMFAVASLALQANATAPVYTSIASAQKTVKAAKLTIKEGSEGFQDLEPRTNCGDDTEGEQLLADQQ